MKEPGIVAPPVNGSAVEPFQKRWFCVALHSSGETYKQDAESPSAFGEVIRQSKVAWVDYIADDPEKAMAEAGVDILRIDDICAPCKPAVYQHHAWHVKQTIGSVPLRFRRRTDHGGMDRHAENTQMPADGKSNVPCL